MRFLLSAVCRASFYQTCLQDGNILSGLTLVQNRLDSFWPMSETAMKSQRWSTLTVMELSTAYSREIEFHWNTIRRFKIHLITLTYSKGESERRFEKGG